MYNRTKREDFTQSGAEKLAGERGGQMRTPQEGDLPIACSDALIAAQTAVIAAESLGIGSCLAHSAVPISVAVAAPKRRPHLDCRVLVLARADEVRVAVFPAA